MQTQRSPRRPAGTGSLFIRTDRAGRESWYAKYRRRRPAGQAQARPAARARHRRGPDPHARRRPSCGRLLAEAATRARSVRESLTLRRGGRALPAPRRARARAQARRPCRTTASWCAATSAPFFAGQAPRRGRARADRRLRHRQAPRGARRRDDQPPPDAAARHLRPRGAPALDARNPVLAVDRPPQRGADPDIRFLELEELEAVLRAVPDDTLGAARARRSTSPPR